MTKIPYCDETLPLVRGCSKISPGCANCYAERNSHRFKTTTEPWISAYAYKNVTLHAELLERPLRWTRPRTIFVCPTGDLFHETVPDGFIDGVFAVMRVSERHRFLILTKRAERMQRYVLSAEMRVHHWAPPQAPKHWYHASDWHWPLPNVWLGVSAENQHWAEARIALLMKTPAAHRWASLEPLLEPLDITQYICDHIDVTDDVEDAPDGAVLDGLERVGDRWERDVGLDWVVVGGESGPGHRPMDLHWMMEIADQCFDAHVPYFGKQASGARPNAALPPSLARRELPWQATNLLRA